MHRMLSTFRSVVVRIPVGDCDEFEGMVLTLYSNYCPG